MTGNKEVQEALKKSEEEFRLSFENAKDAIFWADTETGLIIKCNKAAEALLEKKREEIAGHAQTLLHPQQKSKYYSRMFKEHIAQKGAVDNEAEVITKSGKIKPVHITASVTLIGGKRIIQGIFRDITERKKIEADVFRYGERLRILHEIDCAILTAQSIEKIVYTTLDRIREMLRVHLTSLTLFDFDADEATVFAVSAGGNPELRAGMRFSLEDYGISEELLNGKIHVVEDILSISQLSPVDKKLKAGGIRSYINIPLIFMDESIGSLNLGKDTIGAFTSEEVSIASEVVDELAVAVQQARNQEKLKKSEEKYRNLYDNAPDMCHSLDKNGIIIDCNKAWERMLGYKKEEIIGRPLTDFFTEESRRLFEETFSTLSKDKTLLSVEREFVRKDSTSFHAILNVFVELDESGEPIGNSAIARDITERKKAEETLRKKAEQVINYQMALLELSKMDNSNLDLALKRMTEVDSKTLGVERVSVWLFDEDHSEIICKDLYKLSKNLHEKGLKLYAKHYPRYFQALKENRTMAADDARTDLRTNKLTEEYLKPFGITSMLDVPVRLYGEVVGIVCHAHTGQKREWTLEEQEFAASIADIVSLTLEAFKRKQVEEMLKESEKKYRELVANARVGVYKTNLNGDILFVNNALVKMFEFDSPEEMMSVGVLKLYKNPQDRERLIEAIKERGKVNNFELEAVAKTGKIKDILLSANLEGNTMSGMIIDVTGQRRAERAVRESRMFLSSIFQGIQDGVVVLDRDFMILFANTSYIKQIGCKPEEVQSGHCYEVSYKRSEPCYEAGLECSVKNVFDTGLSSRRISKKGGKYMEMTVYPLRDESGNILSAVEIRRDVTRAVELDGEVKKRVRELEEFYNMAVGRELKMVKLKEEIETLKDELRRYKA